MTPRSSGREEANALQRWQVGPTPVVMPYTNAPPMCEDVVQRPAIDIDLQIAAIMPSIADISSMGTEHFKDWLDDRSWVDYDDR